LQDGNDFGRSIFRKQGFETESKVYKMHFWSLYKFYRNFGPRLGIFFRLLIQIHDELVLEVHDDYIENVKGKNLHLCDTAVLV
jgi:hypothetical protein